MTRNDFRSILAIHAVHRIEVNSLFSSIPWASIRYIFGISNLFTTVFELAV